MSATVRTQLDAIIRIATAPPSRLPYRDRMQSIEGLAKATTTMLDNSREVTEKVTKQMADDRNPGSRFTVTNHKARVVLDG